MVQKFAAIAAVMISLISVFAGVSVMSGDVSAEDSAFVSGPVESESFFLIPFLSFDFCSVTSDDVSSCHFTDISCSHSSEFFFVLFDVESAVFDIDYSESNYIDHVVATDYSGPEPVSLDVSFEHVQRGSGPSFTGLYRLSVDIPDSSFSVLEFYKDGFNSPTLTIYSYRFSESDFVLDFDGSPSFSLYWADSNVSTFPTDLVGWDDYSPIYLWFDMNTMGVLPGFDIEYTVRFGSMSVSLSLLPLDSGATFSFYDESVFINSVCDILGLDNDNRPNIAFYCPYSDFNIEFTNVGSEASDPENPEPVDPNPNNPEKPTPSGDAPVADSEIIGIPGTLFWIAAGLLLLVIVLAVCGRAGGRRR